MSKWESIKTPPQEDTLVVVLWRNGDGEECHEFDWLEDGVWQRHSENYEHYLAVGSSLGPGPKEEAPYTHWLEIPPAPETIS